MSTILQWDTALFELLNTQWTCRLLDVVMPFLTDFDHWRVPVILLVLVGLTRGGGDTRVGLLFAVLAVAATDQLSSSVAKSIFARARPFDVLQNVRQLVDAHGYSFPSSHAANTFAAGTFLSLRFPRWRPVLVIPVLVAYSRVYVGVHYPSDVLGGAILGAGMGWFFTLLERVARLRIERFFVRRRRRRENQDAPED